MKKHTTSISDIPVHTLLSMPCMYERWRSLLSNVTSANNVKGCEHEGPASNISSSDSESTTATSMLCKSCSSCQTSLARRYECGHNPIRRMTIEVDANPRRKRLNECASARTCVLHACSCAKKVHDTNAHCIHRSRPSTLILDPFLQIFENDSDISDNVSHHQ